MFEVLLVVFSLASTNAHAETRESLVASCADFNLVIVRETDPATGAVSSYTFQAQFKDRRVLLKPATKGRKEALGVSPSGPLLRGRLTADTDIYIERWEHKYSTFKVELTDKSESRPCL